MNEHDAGPGSARDPYAQGQPGAGAPGQWPPASPQEGWPQATPGAPWPAPDQSGWAAPGPYQPPQGYPQQSWPASAPVGSPTPWQGNAPGNYLAYGNDPRAPLGGHVPAAVSIDSFQQRRRRWPWLVVAAVVIAVLVALYLGIRHPGADQQPASTPTPTPTATTPVPTATGNQLSVPFVNERDGSQGTWQIDRYQWDSTGVTITMTISVSQGEQVAKFFAISNDDTSNTWDPSPAGDADLNGRVVSQGQSVTGTIRLNAPDSDTTVFLTDSTGTQVTALLVPGS